MIQTLAIVIAIMGAILIVALFALVYKNAKSTKLDRFRSKDAGMADLLNYAAMVDDGVIVGKNGSFMAAWLYSGDDNASSTDQQGPVGPKLRFWPSRRTFWERGIRY